MNRNFILIAASLFALYACSSYTEEQRAALDRGSEVYITHCVSCHGTNGDGMEGAYASLLKPEISKVNTDRAIKLIREGSGFEAGMKPIPINDQELVEVVNYIQNTWGNKADFIAEISNN